MHRIFLRIFNARDLGIGLGLSLILSLALATPSKASSEWLKLSLDQATDSHQLNKSQKSRHGRDHKELAFNTLQKLGLGQILSIYAPSNIRTPTQKANRTSSPFITEYRVSHRNVPLCGANLRIIEEPTGEQFSIGLIPNINTEKTYIATDWADLDDAVSHVEGTWSGDRPITYVHGSAEACYFFYGDELRPAWSMSLRSEYDSYAVIASDETVFSIKRNGFSLVTGQVEAYKRNILSGETEINNIELDGSGYLTNDAFISSPLPQSERYYSADFYYPRSNDSYHDDEASLFAFANTHYDFIRRIGGLWTVHAPILIHPQYNYPGGRGTAEYRWAESDRPATIYVAGSRNVLENMSHDEDVISHELGHHIVYQSIKETFGESRVLHEALADFLVMSRTGSPCIAASVCVNSSIDSCLMFKRQCLRSGENNLHYNDQSYNETSSEYVQSLAVSGFLWDIVKAGVMPRTTLAEYVVHAIKYLPLNAYLTDFFQALYHVDELRGGVFSSHIKLVAESRGFVLKDMLSEKKIDKAAIPLTATLEDADVAIINGCATVGRDDQDRYEKTHHLSSRRSNIGLLLALLLLPFILQFILPLGIRWSRAVL